MWSRRLLFSCTPLAATLAATRDRADCCGIVGAFRDPDAVTHLLEGLERLEARGYDAAGLATLHGRRLFTAKFDRADGEPLARLHAAAPALVGHQTGVAHTRWATHGDASVANAHPHLDPAGRLALVHNGTLFNWRALRAQCPGPFRSETDSEVLAHLLGARVARGQPLAAALTALAPQLVGTWALAVLDRDTGHLVVARQGSPLVVGLDAAGRPCAVASEPDALPDPVERFFELAEGEVLDLADATPAACQARAEPRPHRARRRSPAPFATWTLREIHEQPDGLRRGLEGAVPPLAGADAGGLLLTGCGSSLYAAQFVALVAQRQGHFPHVAVEDAAELTPAQRGAAGPLVAFSQSGETRDTVRAVAGRPYVAVVNNGRSQLARAARRVVDLDLGPERAVASTKAFTGQVLAGLRLLGATAGLDTLPEAFETALRTTGPAAAALAARLADAHSLFVLGKGLDRVVAREAALKIKELAYLHAEAFSGGALKHGPFALLEPGTPVILVATEDAHRERLRVAAEEVRARGAFVVVVTDRPGEIPADVTLPVPAGPWSSLVAVVPLQLLAYELARARGLNVDRPRNLAKTVTVD